jgi:hypothetical protein
MTTKQKLIENKLGLLELVGYLVDPEQPDFTLPVEVQIA